MRVTVVNKFRFVHSLVFFSAVLLFGTAFLTLFLIFNKPIPENYIETNAKITQIEKNQLPTYDASDGIGSDDYEYRVLVEYRYNGKTYAEKEYGIYDSSMKEGDTVLVYLNPENPDEFFSDPSGNFVFVIVGVIVILIGAGGLGYTIYRKKKEGK